MKKLLLFSICLLFSFFYTNGQVIDIVGKGVIGVSNPNLTLTDLDNIDHVNVFAFHKATMNVPPPSDVLFDDADEGPMSTWKTDMVVKTKGPLTKVIGYYTAAFNTVDVLGINAQIVQTDKIHSFYSLIYRDLPDATFKSFIDETPVFMFHNGSADPYVYNIPINEATGPRNVNIKIPITELDDTERMAIIDIEAGPVTLQAVVTTYDLGNSFFIGEYLLNNVPGNVDQITVSIHSPHPNVEDNGDSFFIGGIIADVDIVYEGCTLTQGYWKTHSSCKAKGPKRDDTWDNLTDDENTEFFLSSKNYCEVFDTKPGKGGKYYILAHQYIAAQLNLFNNANPTDVSVAFDAATTFLNTYTPQEVKGNQALEGICVSLGGTLADFNEGSIGPGHCDDGDTDDNADKEEVSKERVSIYPNPASYYNKIVFTPSYDAKTTVELFNLNGQKVSTLYNQNTFKNITVTIDYDTQQLSNGLYIAIIRNGKDVFKEKFSIID